MIDTEQPAQLARVQTRIEAAIVAFASEHVADFHVEDLRRYVQRAVGHVAPASPDRILRQMRLDRKLNYIVVSRLKSLYRWTPITPVPPRNTDQRRLFS